MIDPFVDYLLEDETFKDEVMAEAQRLFEEAMAPPLWIPNPDRDDGTPNPQRLAYESHADVLGYGGAGGGGKTDLGLGLAATNHTHSVIFRRVFKNLRGVIERSREIFNPNDDPHTEDSFNESLHRWRLSDGRIIEFEACQHEKNKFDQRGRPRDLYVFDEATEFSRTQVEFIMGWNRTTIPNQRCRVLLTFNPPLDDSGSWVIDFFLPWIAYLFPEKYDHPNPAAPGELRWYATVDGEEMECESGEPFTTEAGELIQPLSRSFIPAKLDDNPYLNNSNYRAILQSMPEPLRSQLLYGDFTAAAAPNPFQVIPTEWVKLAQKRWLDMVRPNVGLTGVGVDAVYGGKDNMVVIKHYAEYFEEPRKESGVDITDGPTAAAVIYQEIGDEDPLYINIDIVGVGTTTFDSTVVYYGSACQAVNAAAGSVWVDKSGKLKMRNVRAEYYWRMREALDPEHGEGLALPPGHEIVADLCAATYKLTTAGVTIEPKEAIKDRLGRSPDIGEALMMSAFAQLGKQEPEDMEAGVW